MNTSKVGDYIDRVTTAPPILDVKSYWVTDSDGKAHKVKADSFSTSESSGTVVFFLNNTTAAVFRDFRSFILIEGDEK